MSCQWSTTVYISDGRVSSVSVIKNAHSVNQLAQKKKKAKLALQTQVRTVCFMDLILFKVEKL